MADTFFPVIKSSGITPSERYLERVCERNFLKLWSYARPFRDQGNKKHKEICDHLVVMGNDVVIFSDKHCVLEPKKGLAIDWQRWFRSAVQEGAKQAWGAERWMRQHPNRVFLDPECTRLLPVQIPQADVARYHLVVTVHGVSAACRRMLGGTGSLMMRTDVEGFEAHTEPFVIGDLDSAKSFVHVFDDATLDFVTSNLDTATDFLRYLVQKERLLRSRTMHIAGEENLLAHYLTTVDENLEHTFDLPDADLVSLDESWWQHFASSDERRARIEHDKISYAWDNLIERFAEHALDGTQYFASHPTLDSSETILRFMAAEPRLHRRALAGALIESIETTPRDDRRLRVIPPGLSGGEPTYVFLICPWFETKTEAENRDFRRKYLEACLMVAKLTWPQALDIVGIATETDVDRTNRTEDALYLDAREWTAEDDADARKLQRELGILERPRRTATSVIEYPVGPVERNPRVPKNPRNKPCPCGSSRKYKQCCG